MKVVLFPYNSFVLPFLIGVFILLGLCIYKYIRWIRAFDAAQRRTFRTRWWAFNLLPALWEMCCEGLLHLRIFKKNLRLGIMHQALALGWFLLIVVGAIESTRALRTLDKEQSAARMESMTAPGHWYRFDKEKPNLPEKKQTVEVDGTKVKIDFKRPFYVSIFYRYFVHGLPPDFKHHRAYAHTMDALLLYVLFGLVLALAKLLKARLLGLRHSTKHNLIDRFSKFSLWAIFPLRLAAESVTASLYGNGGFLTQGIGDLLSPFALWTLELPLWIAYSFSLGVFFVTLPFTRYMHIFTELLLVYFRKVGLRESEAPTGYTQFELNACSRCGICIEGCPLDKELGKRRVQSVYLLRGLRNHEHPARIRRMADNCLLCNRCTADCPVGLELEPLRVMARHKGDLDKPSGYAYLEQTQRAFNAIGRVAYFGGCMSRLTPSITEAMQRIFEAAGQKYWFMDQQGTVCCGRPLRQQGFLQQARALRETNTRLLKESGAQLLITSCPICYRSFKEEYHLDIPVLHHTEYIERLLRKGRIAVSQDARTVAYHDPCELGRGSGIYAPPRKILRQVAQLQKTRNEKEKSLCCGFNLGNTALSLEEQGRLRDAALRSLTAGGAQMVVTACPMCKKSFTHGAVRTPVQDIAELVAAHLIPS